ncbi:hypothetical protein C2G38_2233229 [Gigaspora rosea]|uniref:Uncharacterized protein n=1 Tax=Gigaspora rosea TaxID=44941 RepID=A0A397U0Y4_9GLOM|nr:hypothetical protein C2G38_2233229 [Gigaspora rosea]
MKLIIKKNQACIKFKDPNFTTQTRLDAIVHVCNEALLDRDRYKSLAAIINIEIFNIDKEINDQFSIYSSEYTSDILVDNSKENYEVLAKVGKLFASQLANLKENSIIDNNGQNALNSEYFCLFCECNAKSHYNIDLTWLSTRNTKALFPVIDLLNYISDELHLLLQILDVLIEFLFKDLFKKMILSKILREELKKMSDLSIHFEFFIILLKLYGLLRTPTHTEEEILKFEEDAKNWVKTFCQPTVGQLNTAITILGLYRKEDIMPYMHMFCMHIPYFMRQLKKKGLSLRLFSTSSIEKNYNQVKLFFGGTIIREGKKQKPVVYDILKRP